jgi:hypothetical protein
MRSRHQSARGRREEREEKNEILIHRFGASL